MLSIDFETRSTCDLKVAGLFRYARDPSTDILCMAWSFDTFVHLWKPGTPLPIDITEYILQYGKVAAHNVAFEFEIWNKIGHGRYGWPPLLLEQMVCNLAACAAVSLPLGLEPAAKALGLPDRKDAEGRRIMLQLSRPRKYENGEPIWWDDPEKSLKLFKYCEQDVRVEQAIAAKVPGLTPYERKVWTLDQKINAKGVAIDAEFVTAAVRLAASERARLDLRMEELTGGVAKACSQVGKIKTFLASIGMPNVSLAKVDLAETIADPFGEWPEQAYAVMHLRASYAKTAVAKYDSMLAYQVEGRVRGGLQYHGATTGRWAGKGPQMQNLYKGDLSPEAVESVIRAVTAGYPDRIRDVFGEDSVMDVLAACLRGAIIGDVLTSVDYSAVESRIIAWLAGEESKLAMHREGKVYEKLAARIYDVPVEAVNPRQRGAGKVADLACGFQGGVAAYQRMAKTSGVRISDEEAAKVVAMWRKSHPNVVRFWYKLQSCAEHAIRTPGVPFSCGPITFKVTGGVLWVRLPSGRQLAYPQPKLDDGITFGAAIGKTWTRFHTYGGSLAENVTQAVARDLLADAMLRADKEGLGIVLHVHDEIIVDGPECQKALSDIMLDSADWAAGLPLATEGWSARRYRK